MFGQVDTLLLGLLWKLPSCYPKYFYTVIKLIFSFLFLTMVIKEVAINAVIFTGRKEDFKAWSIKFSARAVANG